MTESADTLKERERCAKVAEDHECGEVYPDNCHCWARIASNIRQPPANDNPKSPASSPEAIKRAMAEVIKANGEVHRQLSTTREQLAQELLVSDRLRLSWREDVETERKRVRLLSELRDAEAKERDELRSQLAEAKQEYEDERTFIELLETESGCEINGSVGCDLVAWIRKTKNELAETRGIAGELREALQELREAIISGNADREGSALGIAEILLAKTAGISPELCKSTQTGLV